ncbi:hypothetical protein HPB52_002122 [Rhipicephalus sanguineus]|uniref:Uncharacterized protein n=1 Tax=Rhipicephalus sanguineus TaxID=34632 RepID=A0A9D4T5A5_RHISA|nr:hypothetical protein HPB52_002122 [Rhipicephalus sanguineus]
MRMAVRTLVFFFIGYALLDSGSATVTITRLALRRSSTEACIPDGESRSIGDRSSCTFTRFVDFDSNRFPYRIPTVSCKCPGVLCSPLGDFRCHEIKEELQVMVRGRDGMLRNDTMEVTVSCVCALGRSGEAAAAGFRIVNYEKTRKNSGLPSGTGTLTVR